MTYRPGRGDLVKDENGMYGIVTDDCQIPAKHNQASIAWANGTEEFVDPTYLYRLQVIPLLPSRADPGLFTPANFIELLEGRLPSQLERKQCHVEANASEQVLATQTPAGP